MVPATSLVQHFCPSTKLSQNAVIAGASYVAKLRCNGPTRGTGGLVGAGTGGLVGAGTGGLVGTGTGGLVGAGTGGLVGAGTGGFVGPVDGAAKPFGGTLPSCVFVGPTVQDLPINSSMNVCATT